jgi:hypothetical protein
MCSCRETIRKKKKDTKIFKKHQIDKIPANAMIVIRSPLKPCEKNPENIDFLREVEFRILGS